MKTGMGLMKIAPSEFWSMTPNDFWAVYHAMFTKPNEGMSRANLLEMMKRNPD